MTGRYLITFLVFLLFSSNVVLITALPENKILYVDNNYRVAYAGDLVEFNVSIANNKNVKDTFFIQPIWADSVLCLPMYLINDTVYDFSHFRNHCTNYGAVVADGLLGSAMSFDGINDYLEVEDSASLSNYAFSNELTVAYWCKLDAVPDSWTSLISKPFTWGEGFNIQYTHLEEIFIWLGLNGTRGDVIKYVYPDLVGNWTHIAFTAKDGFARLYINNVEVASTNYVLNLTAASGPLIINGGDSYWEGSIDEVYIFDRALHFDEIGWLYSNGWNEILSESIVELDAGVSEQLTFSVRIPENATSGYVKNFLLSVFPFSDPEQVESQTLTVEVLPIYHAELNFVKDQQLGVPEETLNFKAEIQNLGNIEDTYDILIDGEAKWGLTLSTESLFVPSGAVGSFNVSITVPYFSLPDDHVSFRIRIVSHGNPDLTLHVDGTAVALAMYNFSISSKLELIHATPESEIFVSINLNNLGTASDTIYLETYAPVGWVVDVEPRIHLLKLNETGTVSVMAKVPKEALIGQTNAITIRAVSSNDPTVSVNSSISVAVITPFWDSPDVRFIAGLFIGVLVGATLISTIILRRSQITLRK